MAVPDRRISVWDSTPPITLQTTIPFDLATIPVLHAMLTVRAILDDHGADIDTTCVDDLKIVVDRLHKARYQGTIGALGTSTNERLINTAMRSIRTARNLLGEEVVWKDGRSVGMEEVQRKLEGVRRDLAGVLQELGRRPTSDISVAIAPAPSGSPPPKVAASGSGAGTIGGTISESQTISAPGLSSSSRSPPPHRFGNNNTSAFPNTSAAGIVSTCGGVTDGAITTTTIPTPSPTTQNASNGCAISQKGSTDTRSSIASGHGVVHLPAGKNADPLIPIRSGSHAEPAIGGQGNPRPGAAPDRRDLMGINSSRRVGTPAVRSFTSPLSEPTPSSSSCRPCNAFELALSRIDDSSSEDSPSPRPRISQPQSANMQSPAVTGTTSGSKGKRRASRSPLRRSAPKRPRAQSLSSSESEHASGSDATYSPDRNSAESDSFGEDADPTASESGQEATPSRQRTRRSPKGLPPATINGKKNARWNTAFIRRIGSPLHTSVQKVINLGWPVGIEPFATGIRDLTAFPLDRWQAKAPKRPAIASPFIGDIVACFIEWRHWEREANGVSARYRVVHAEISNIIRIWGILNAETKWLKYGKEILRDGDYDMRVGLGFSLGQRY